MEKNVHHKPMIQDETCLSLSLSSSLNHPLFEFETLIAPSIQSNETKPIFHLKNIFYEASLIKRHNTPNHATFTCALSLKLFDKLPKVLCFINKTHLIGIDSETIYLIDHHFKYIRTASLYETLHLKVYEMFLVF